METETKIHEIVKQGQERGREGEEKRRWDGTCSFDDAPGALHAHRWPALRQQRYDLVRFARVGLSWQRDRSGVGPARRLCDALSEVEVRDTDAAQTN